MTGGYILRSIAIAKLTALEVTDPFATIADAKRVLADMAAADVAPVRHGRWIRHDDGVFTCSECGNAESNDSYYCRLCGAKMDGGNEGEREL